MVDFSAVTEFEKQVAAFFGAPYGVAVDSCTHGIELCLRYTQTEFIGTPNRTYLSVPMLANKLRIKLYWHPHEPWVDYYYVTGNLIDAAVLWRPNSYITGTFMCLSFQYQKHLSIGRGGMILCDNKEAAEQLRKMAYDGRERGIPWRDQNVSAIGYHYYLLPELAELGLKKLPAAIATPPKIWDSSMYPDLTKMDIFK